MKKLNYDWPVEKDIGNRSVLKPKLKSLATFSHTSSPQ